MNVTYRDALITCTTDEFLDLCRKGLFNKERGTGLAGQGMAEFVRQGMADVVPVYGCVVTLKDHVSPPEIPVGGQSITATQNCEDDTIDLKCGPGESRGSTNERV